MPAWRVEHLADDVSAFHARPLAGERSATFFRPQEPTLVLGSAQRAESVDSEAARRLGIAVARRRSGGGGVLLWPDEQVWLDLEIPASDPLWDDDVGRAMWWVGELWQTALAPLVPLATVHRGRLLRAPWSSVICFAGIGPGELVLGDAKLVGISQRRTRAAARFQTMVHLRWRPDVVAALVADAPTIETLTPLAATCPAPAADITTRLIAALDQL